MRVGVVGCGNWGARHVRVLHEMSDVDHVVLIDANEAQTGRLARRYPSVSCYRTLDEAIGSVDALVVATPPRSHAALALQAITAGKHVLVEKPLATSSADASELIDQADRAGVVLMVGHTFLYNSAVRQLRELVQDGQLGELLRIDSERLALGLYQNDVNVMWDLAPHDVSILDYVLGEHPVAVSAWGDAHLQPAMVDVASIRLHYDESALHRGFSALIKVSWLHPQKVRRMTLVGTRKMAIYDEVDPLARLQIYDRGVSAVTDRVDAGSPQVSYRDGGLVIPALDFDEPLIVEAQEFIDAIAAGRPPLTDGASGLAVVRVIEGAERSLRSGGDVKLKRLAAVAPRFDATEIAL